METVTVGLIVLLQSNHCCYEMDIEDHMDALQRDSTLM